MEMKYAKCYFMHLTHDLWRAGIKNLGVTDRSWVSLSFPTLFWVVGVDDMKKTKPSRQQN